MIIAAIEKRDEGVLDPPVTLFDGNVDNCILYVVNVTGFSADFSTLHGAAQYLPEKSAYLYELIRCHNLDWGLGISVNEYKMAVLPEGKTSDLGGHLLKQAGIGNIEKLDAEPEKALSNFGNIYPKIEEGKEGENPTGPNEPSLKKAYDGFKTAFKENLTDALNEATGKLKNQTKHQADNPTLKPMALADKEKDMEVPF